MAKINAIGVVFLSREISTVTKCAIIICRQSILFIQFYIHAAGNLSYSGGSGNSSVCARMRLQTLKTRVLNAVLIDIYGIF